MQSPCVQSQKKHYLVFWKTSPLPYVFFLPESLQLHHTVLFSGSNRKANYNGRCKSETQTENTSGQWSITGPFSHRRCRAPSTYPVTWPHLLIPKSTIVWKWLLVWSISALRVINWQQIYFCTDVTKIYPVLQWPQAAEPQQWQI